MHALPDLQGVHQPNKHFSKSTSGSRIPNKDIPATFPGHIDSMQYELLIDGKLVKGDGIIAVIDPATGHAFAHCAKASPRHVDDAVGAAQRAFAPWSRRALAERQAVLHAIADIVEANRDELARLLTQEQGKPLNDSLWEVDGATYIFRHYAATDLPVKIIADDATRRVEAYRQPLGPVAAILPWNFPLFMAAAKIAPALLTGNTLVLKPAPTTPLATLRLGALCVGAIPAGVLNILADENDIGPLLTAHPGIRKVAFTGSTQTGIKVMGAVVPTMKRLTLELGGNDAGIVLDDCDPKAIAEGLYAAAFTNNGQICVAMKRLYVPDALYDDVCSELRAIVTSKVVGPGLDPRSQLGPIQNRQQFEKVKALIETSRRDGKILCGGEASAEGGYFIQPTLVRDISDDAPLVKEEQFGPVLPIIRYQQLEDAIARANATPFGLGNSVWSPNLARAHAVAQQLDSGTVWINKHGDVTPDVPFAGAKMSGIGTEYAEDGLHELTQLKVINVGKP
ncbi:aldehyde dehydrogenase family protein [Burkholderia pseudomultivorans]|uniref:aldehyde dehydrogenase family protein n=1 Tax=Burkholderia pseudomultivorans TaxID=1207504 RepID=UPI001E319DF4|nr:aldehyde dehydrogenase family protein [Burkholderia pseudomultivorans]